MPSKAKSAPAAKAAAKATQKGAAKPAAKTATKPTKSKTAAKAKSKPAAAKGGKAGAKKGASGSDDGDDDEEDDAASGSDDKAQASTVSTRAPRLCGPSLALQDKARNFIEQEEILALTSSDSRKGYKSFSELSSKDQTNALSFVWGGHSGSYGRCANLDSYNTKKEKFADEMTSSALNDRNKLRGVYNDAAREMMIEELKDQSLAVLYRKAFKVLKLFRVLTQSEFTTAKEEMQHLLSKGKFSKKMEGMVKEFDDKEKSTSGPGGSGNSSNDSNGSNKNAKDIGNKSGKKRSAATGYGMNSIVPVDDHYPGGSKEWKVLKETDSDANGGKGGKASKCPASDPDAPCTIFDIMLNQADVKNNANKFYVLQLLEHKTDKNKYSVWTRWGRVGVVGQSLDEEFEGDKSLEKAKAFFAEKFKNKTGGTFGDFVSDPDGFAHKKGKYCVIEMDYDNDTELKNKKKAKFDAVSKLDKDVREFVEMITSKEMIEKQLTDVGYDVKKMPLGKISGKMIDDGYEVLQEINAELESPSADHDQKLEDLSSKFYTVVPHNFGFKKLKDFVLKSTSEVKEKLELVDSLKQIETAVALLKADKKKKKNSGLLGKLKNGVKGLLGGGSSSSSSSSASADAADDDDDTPDQHPTDEAYDKLDINLTPVKKGSDDWKRVEKMSKDTHGSSHNCFKLKLEKLFYLNKRSQNVKFDKYMQKSPHIADENRMLLWHGSRLTNWVGILSEGLRIAPPKAPVSGYMFGKGVYFADIVSKSANYCCTSSSNSTGLMLLEEVALGLINPLTSSDYHAQVALGLINPLTSSNYHAQVALGKINPLHSSDYHADKTARQNACDSTQGMGQTAPHKWEEIDTVDVDGKNVGQTAPHEWEKNCTVDVDGNPDEDSDMRVKVPVGDIKTKKNHKGYLMYNEYIVYNTAQSRPRFLCQFKFEYGDEEDSDY